MYSVKNVVDPLSPLLRSAVSTAGSLIPLKSLRHGFLEELFLHVTAQSIVDGDVLFEQGAYDGQVIYLSSGALQLEYLSGHRERIEADTAILPLANQQPRPCKAIALGDCMVLRMDADRLDRTLSWSQITDYVMTELSMNRDHDGHLEWMTTVLSSNLFFKVPSVNAEQIFDRLVTVEVNKGETIIKQGDIGDCCYFLKEGEADIVKYIEGREPEKIAEIVSGRCFGEDALVERKPRNATVVMASDGVLMHLEKDDFLRLLAEPAVEDISIQELDQRVDSPILIDVRTDAEYRLGHLALSANLPVSILALKKRLLSLEQPYVLYCDTGRRSRAAAHFLGKEGYNVVSLAGGLHKQSLFDCIVESPSYMLRDGVLATSDD